MKINDFIKEDGQRLDPSCWKGYKKQGTKMKGGKRVNNCVKEEAEKRWKQTSLSPAEATKMYGKENVKVKKGGLRNGDDMVSVFVESVNEGTQGCADCEWIKDETDGDIDTCDECAAEKRQTNEAEKRWKQTSMSPQEAIAKYGKENVKVKKGALRNGDDMVEVFVESMNEAGGYYTQPVYDMIKQHGYPKVMHRLLSALDADVIQDALSTMNTENESYSPGDEMEDGVVSNCCGAQLMDYNDGHGRCSDCKEMASAERMEESVNESVVNEAKDNLYLQLHKKYAEQIKGLKAKKIKKLSDLVWVQRRSMSDRDDYFDMDSKKKKELSAEYRIERSLLKKYMARDYSVMLPKRTEKLPESVNEENDTYFKTAGEAVDFAKTKAEKKGYEIDEDDWNNQITHGGRYSRLRPSVGKTHTFQIGLLKKGKPQRKGLSISLFGMDSGNYELTYYIN